MISSFTLDVESSVNEEINGYFHSHIGKAIDILGESFTYLPAMLDNLAEIVVYNWPETDAARANRAKQEVRAENAFLCLSQALTSNKTNVHDETSARLMILLIRDQKHLINKVEQACRNEHANPYNLLDMFADGLPMDMPMATSTKMLFTAYSVYDGIIDKANVSNEFVNAIEKNAYDNVRRHIIDNCNQLNNISSRRKIELGSIVFGKICDRLRKDIAQYSDSM